MPVVQLKRGIAKLTSVAPIFLAPKSALRCDITSSPESRGIGGFVSDAEGDHEVATHGLVLPTARYVGFDENDSRNAFALDTLIAVEIEATIIMSLC